MSGAFPADQSPVHCERILALVAALAILRAPAAALQPKAQERLVVTVGKSLSIDSPITSKRVAIANTSLAETIVIGPKEVLINGLAPGETSLVIWQEGDIRTAYDLLIRPSSLRLEAVREQIEREYPGVGVDLS